MKRKEKKREEKKERKKATPLPKTVFSNNYIDNNC